MVDRQGIPLALGVPGANRPDDPVFAALVDAVAPITHPRGRPRPRPTKLHADQGSDYPHCRQTVRQRGIQTRMARPGVESKSRLGRYRWVADRTLAWRNRFRRLPMRYERRADLHQAFLDLGCALICLRALAGRF